MSAERSMGTGARHLFDPSNQPDTCLWCGRKLRAYRFRDLLEPNGINPDARGAYADDSFCSMRCGYEFGLAMVRNGHRLAKRVSRREVTT